jgi:Tfp pilus assembly protein PilF
VSGQQAVNALSGRTQASDTPARITAISSLLGQCAVGRLSQTLGRRDQRGRARCARNLGPSPVIRRRLCSLTAAMVEKALSLNPNLAIAHFAFGWISIVACEPEKAIESFRSMIRFSPLDNLRVNASAGIAWALWLQGRYDEGLALARRATVFPNVQGFGSLIANCVATGQMNEAKMAVAELVKLDPNLRTARAREMFPLRKAEFRSKLDEALRAASLPE